MTNNAYKTVNYVHSLISGPLLDEICVSDSDIEKAVAELYEAMLADCSGDTRSYPNEKFEVGSLSITSKDEHDYRNCLLDLVAVLERRRWNREYGFAQR